MTPGDLQDRFYYETGQHGIKTVANVFDRHTNTLMCEGVLVETAEKICKALNADKQLNRSRSDKLASAQR